MSQTIRKAIIPAAGRGSRHYPASTAIRKEFFPLIDRDGMSRAAIHLIVAEALSAGVEEVCIVVAPGDQEDFLRYFSGMSERDLVKFAKRPAALAEAEKLADMRERLVFVEQAEQHGLGHAIWCARDFAADEPVLIMLGDHINVSETEKSCAAQTVDAWADCGGYSVSAVRANSEKYLHLCGVIRPESEDGPPWKVERMFEKPDLETARKFCRLNTQSDRAYLTFFGIHVLTAEIFELLDHLITNDIRDKEEIQLTSAQSLLAERGHYLATRVEGESYDIGIPEGLAVTQSVLTALGPFADTCTNAVNEALSSKLVAK